MINTASGKRLSDELSRSMPIINVRLVLTIGTAITTGTVTTAMPVRAGIACTPFEFRDKHLRHYPERYSEYLAAIG